MGSNGKIKNKQGKNHYNGSTKTQNNFFKSDSSSISDLYGKDKSSLEVYALQSLVENVTNLSGKIEKLETDNKNINDSLRKIRIKENRLLNRFGWTLIMANLLLGVLAGITVLGYFQFVYPVLQKNINSEGVFELLKWIMFGILGFLTTIWVSVMKFADYIRKRDQTTREELWSLFVILIFSNTIKYDII